MATLAAPSPITIELSEWFSSEFSISGKKSLRRLLSEPESYYAHIHQSIQVGQELDRNLAGIKLLIEVNLLVGQSKEPVDLHGRFELYFGFEVPNLEAFPVAHPTQEITMAAFELVIRLVSISHSTARGILMARLAGTPLDGFSLPLIDATELVSEGELTTTTKLRS